MNCLRDKTLKNEIYSSAASYDLTSCVHNDTICPCPSPPPWAPQRLARRRADAT